MNGICRSSHSIFSGMLYGLSGRTAESVNLHDSRTLENQPDSVHDVLVGLQRSKVPLFIEVFEFLCGLPFYHGAVHVNEKPVFRLSILCPELHEKFIEHIAALPSQTPQ